MSIEHIETKIKIGETREENSRRNRFLNLDNNLFVVFTIILVAFASFGLGRLSVIKEKTSIVFPQKISASSQKAQLYTPPNIQETPSSFNEGLMQKGSVVASKNGAKYHFPWCSGAVRIKEENKIWFNGITEAKKAGYEPAQNCKGLK